MQRRDDLSDREQLMDAVIHASPDAPFERLRQQLEGGLAGLPPYVVGAIDLPEYTAVNEAAISRIGNIAFVGLTRGREDNSVAQLREWHPRTGLSPSLLRTASRISHVHYPEGNSQPAYVYPTSVGDEGRLVWGHLTVDVAREPARFRATTSLVNGESRFTMVSGEEVACRSFSCAGAPRFVTYRGSLLGFAHGEPVVMETSEGQRSQRRVRCGEWTSEWFDGVWYRGVDKSGEVEIFARQLVDGKMGLWLVSQQGERQLASSIDPNNMFATRGRLFEVVSGSGRSRLRDHTSEFDVEFPMEIRVQSVVCDEESVHVYGLFETYGARRDEPHYAKIDLVTQRVLRSHGVEESKLEEVGGRALLIGKRTFEDLSAPDPWRYPHYGHPDRLTPVNGGLASWHFVDGTFYALTYELSPVIS